MNFTLKISIFLSFGIFICILIKYFLKKGGVEIKILFFPFKIQIFFLNKKYIFKEIEIEFNNFQFIRNSKKWKYLIFLQNVQFSIILQNFEQIYEFFLLKEMSNFNFYYKNKQIHKKFNIFIAFFCQIIIFVLKLIKNLIFKFIQIELENILIIFKEVFKDDIIIEINNFSIDSNINEKV